MAKTVQQFINQYNGKSVDYDGSFGVQCVDGFKLFCSWAKYPVKATGNGWADGYWYNRKTSGYSYYFEFITDKKKLQSGDWLIWARGSSCKDSHIGMFVGYSDSSKTKAKVFGQNQRGKNDGFSTMTYKLDILGAFRPKMWKTTVVTSNPVTPTKNIVATGKATGFSNSFAKTYQTTANLNLRNGGGTNYKILTTIPKGKTVTCYGYYSKVGSVYWLYVQYLSGATLYTGFCSKDYLK